MNADGSGQRLLAQVGVSCSDPAFSPDGSAIVFAVDESGLQPLQRAIWAVTIADAQTIPLTNQTEWDFFGPQWLAEGGLVFAAGAEDGRQTFFVRDGDGNLNDLGASLLVDEDNEVRYQDFGRPLASRDGQRFALTALRADRPGAELLVLERSGRLLDTIISDSTDREFFWTRGLSWDSDNTLLYLGTTCESTVVQDYVLSRWSAPNQSSLIIAGTTLNTIGSAVSFDGQITYILAEQANSGPRGPDSCPDRRNLVGLRQGEAARARGQTGRWCCGDPRWWHDRDRSQRA